MAALNDPGLQVRVFGLLTRNPPGGGALFRGELLDGSPVAVFVARRQCASVGGGGDDGAFASSTSLIPPQFSIPPLLGAGAAHPNVVQLFAVRETLVRGGCGAASGALLPPARGHWVSSASSSSNNSASAVDAPLSLAAALAAAGAPLPDSSTMSFPSSSSSISSPPLAALPEIETVAVYEFCERGTLRDAIRAFWPRRPRQQRAGSAAAEGEEGVGAERRRCEEAAARRSRPQQQQRPPS